ncbi:phasin family protein [Prosthecomicrobium pneumaticum]|uniref:Phasin domain-containing protein n=1 Tax=Prosthecomicrobium pneumaticum TaxID=81895 RepID=A0A7W9FNW5_9HYPH|nr:phasin family protein [Prosthecomicrobium pneumaticum]MBB5754165.1 hypothetical protein [Prosthecomicrobium pneumaticum]
MAAGFDDMQKVGKDSMDNAMKSLSAFSKGMQAIAVEAADYSKKSFETGTAALEKLLAAKSIDKVVELQSDYVRSSYEGYVAEMTKMGEMFTELTKSAYKPYEALFGKVPAAK